MHPQTDDPKKLFGAIWEIIGFKLATESFVRAEIWVTEKSIKDGKIDESERRLMGVGYIVLRIAMVAILRQPRKQDYLVFQSLPDSFRGQKSLFGR